MSLCLLIFLSFLIVIIQWFAVVFLFLLGVPWVFLAVPELFVKQAVASVVIDLWLFLMGCV